jgi:rSAM/selenodomain-associated transferase 2
VIIPALDEAERIRAAIGSAGAEAHEVIVVDGGSRDSTVERAAAAGARVLRSPRGRAMQMNRGALAAESGILVFLHGDSLLPPGYSARVRRTLGRAGTAAGAFSLRITPSSPGRALIGAMANARSRLLQLPYGDQALFMTNAAFRRCGGYACLPIMEDYDLALRLRRWGRIAIAPAPVAVSARRWEKLGLWRTTMMNYAIVPAYHLGVPATRLAGWYRGR